MTKKNILPPDYTNVNAKIGEQKFQRLLAQIFLNRCLVKGGGGGGGGGGWRRYWTMEFLSAGQQ